MNQGLAQLTILPPVTTLSLSVCKYQPLQYLSSSSKLRNLVYFGLRNNDKLNNSVNEDGKALVTRNQIFGTFVTTCVNSKMCLQTQ